jgi:hypothetical protein
MHLYRYSPPVADSYEIRFADVLLILFRAVCWQCTFHCHWQLWAEFPTIVDNCECLLLLSCGDFCLPRSLTAVSYYSLSLATVKLFTHVDISFPKCCKISEFINLCHRQLLFMQLVNDSCEGSLHWTYWNVSPTVNVLGCYINAQLLPAVIINSLLQMASLTLSPHWYWKLWIVKTGFRAALPPYSSAMALVYVHV